MRIFMEVDEAFDVYHVKLQSYVKRRYFGSLSSLLQDHIPLNFADSSAEDVFLLHEKAFDYVDFTVVLSCKEPFSVSDLKEIIAEKTAYAKDVYGFDSPYCKYRIRSIEIDGLPSDYVLGKTWNVSFSLQFFLLRDEYLRHFRRYLPEHRLSSSAASLYPRSLFLLDYLQHCIPANELIFLTLYDRTCQLIRCHTGRYAHIDEIPMWESFLKSCYAEHAISDYVYHDQEAIEHNALLKKLITESVTFYNQQLVRRIAQYVLHGQWLVLLGNPVKNMFFVETFQTTYVEWLWWFVVPVSSIPWSERYGTVMPSDICAVWYMLHKLHT